MSQMYLTPPAYTNQEPVQLDTAQRAARVLPGTEVRIRIQPSKPIVQATLTAGTEAIAEAETDGPWYTAAFVAMASRTYHFNLLDESGLSNRKPVRFSIRVVKDDPPRVRMTLPSIGDIITPAAVLPIEVACDDGPGLRLHAADKVGGRGSTWRLPTTMRPDPRRFRKVQCFFNLPAKVMTVVVDGIRLATVEERGVPARAIYFGVELIGRTAGKVRGLTLHQLRPRP